MGRYGGLCGEAVEGWVWDGAVREVRIGGVWVGEVKIGGGGFWVRMLLRL